MKSIPAVLALAIAAPAGAQDLRFSMSATLSCLDGAAPGARIGCVGASAEACMADTVGGDSTVGMGGCLNAEFRYWDGRLNRVYRRLRAAERAEDAEYGGGPGWTSNAEALRAMQRAWVPFRDATCDYERAQWGGGTGGGPATAACLMRETAEQVFYLEDAEAGP